MEQREAEIKGEIESSQSKKKNNNINKNLYKIYAII